MPPRLLAAHSTSLTDVRLAFDGPVTVTVDAAASLVPLDPPAVLAAATAWFVDGSSATVTVSPDLSPRSRYTVSVSGVVDGGGAPLEPPNNQAVFAPVTPRRPAPRRFELWRMLPQHVRASDDSGDLARFIACAQDVVDVILADLDQWPRILDITRAPEPFVDAILQDLGNPFPLSDDLGAKRRLAASLVDIYRQKGTAIGIQNALRFLFGLGSTIEPYAAEVLSLGDAELGADWILGPSARWGRYAFDVGVSRALTADERARVRVLVEYMKPAHTHFVSLIEPGPPPPSEDWLVGDSDLGGASRLA